MKPTVFLFLILISVSISYWSCGSKERKERKNSIIRTETIDGVINVFNPLLPQKGTITLQLKKILEIDPVSVDPDKTVFFNIAAKSAEGNIYIGDINNTAIYAFDKNGKFGNRFFSRGDGPGQIPYGLFSIQPSSENGIWVTWLMKIMKFDEDAKIIEEIKLRKKYENIEIIDDNRFIGNFFIYSAQVNNPSKRRKCVCAMLTKNEQVLVPFLEDENAGFTEIKKKINGQVMNINFNVGGITPKIIHRFDADTEKLYACVSSEYKIYIKNLKGETTKIIHMEHRIAKLSEKDRAMLAGELFKIDPPGLRKIKEENLPLNLCAVKDFHLLQGGFLAVSRIKSLLETELDIINPEGYFIYRLKLPFENPGAVVYFKGDILALVQTVDDNFVFREYRIKNVPEVFFERESIRRTQLPQPRP